MLPLRFPFFFFFFILDFAAGRRAKPGNKNVVGYIMCPVGNKYVVVVLYFFFIFGVIFSLFLSAFTGQ